MPPQAISAACQRCSVVARETPKIRNAPRGNVTPGPEVDSEPAQALGRVPHRKASCESSAGVLVLFEPVVPDPRARLVEPTAMTASTARPRARGQSRLRQTSTMWVRRRRSLRSVIRLARGRRVSRWCRGRARARGPRSGWVPLRVAPPGRVDCVDTDGEEVVPSSQDRVLATRGEPGCGGRLGEKAVIDLEAGPAVDGGDYRRILAGARRPAVNGSTADDVRVADSFAKRRSIDLDQVPGREVGAAISDQ